MVRYSWGMTSRLGRRLSSLSKDTGHSSRRATSAHRAQWKAFGAFFSTSRSSTTASTRKLAEMLRFRISVKLGMAHTSRS